MGVVPSGAKEGLKDLSDPSTRNSTETGRLSRSLRVGTGDGSREKTRTGGEVGTTRARGSWESGPVRRGVEEGLRTGAGGPPTSFQKVHIYRETIMPL